MDSHTQNATLNFDFDFTMPQQSFDGLKASGQGNTASGYFDEGIDTTASGSIFGQQSFDSIFDPSISTSFGMEQPLVSFMSPNGRTEHVADDIADLG